MITQFPGEKKKDSPVNVSDIGSGNSCFTKKEIKL